MTIDATITTSPISATVNASGTVQASVASSSAAVSGVSGGAGPTGAEGPQGVAGPAGPANTLTIGTVTTGTAAASISGTAPAQVLSLVLPVGPQGPAGPQGPQGVAGATGAVGPAGPKGDTGAAGATGPQGPQGPAGATGAQGPAGATGAAGAQGPQGVAGPQGPQGPQGDTGPAGTTTWAGITDKPSTFTPSSHTHAVADVTGLQTALDSKQAAGSYVTTSDSRLTDAREWSASTVTQADAEAGVATARVAFTVARVWQAIAAWWAASSAKTKLDGIATGATANQTDAYLLARANHTGTQAAATITGLATVATSGSYADLSGTPSAYSLPAATTSTLGGVIVGSGLGVTSGTVSANVTSVAGRTGAVTIAAADVSGLAASATTDTTAAGNITSGTLAIARIPTGTTSSTVCVGNDSRLSDARTPTAHNQAWSTITSTPTTLAGYGITDAAASSHSHGNITSAGAIGSTADRIAVTTTSGVLTTAAIGSGLTLSGGTLTATGGGSIPDPYELGTYPLITISAQPATTTVGVGNTATVSVTAAATLPTATITYQWQNSTDGGTTWLSISGATASSYTTPSLSAGTYRYRCQLSANLSLIYTSVAVITSQASSFLAISRTNGTSTFTGQGNSASPYVRATAVLASSSDAIDYYRFTASASGTVSLSIEAFGDGFDVIFSKNAVVVKRQYGGSFTWTTCTASIAVVSGDVISVSYYNASSGESTRNVSVYAA